jgi:glyoxylase-like metal-dependent hydrolase (beta-lactamase superfamily II)
VYVLESAGGLVLIDSGWALPQSEQLLKEGLATIGYSLHDIRQFIVTHIHSDHFGQAIALRDTYRAEVVLGAGEKESLRSLQSRTPAEAVDGDAELLERAGATELARAVRRAAVVDPASARWADPDTWMETGDQFSVDGRSLEAIATPGHTRGHMVLHDRELQLLFSGDHVLPTITPSIGFEPARARLPLASYLDSLSMLLTLDDCTLLPAHGAPGGSVHTRIEELLHHHASRLTEMESAVDGAGRTSYEVAQLVTWTRRKRQLDELDTFNQMLAVLETESHLKLLVATDRLVHRVTSGVDRFSRITPAILAEGRHFSSAGSATAP